MPPAGCVGFISEASVVRVLCLSCIWWNESGRFFGFLSQLRRFSLTDTPNSPVNSMSRRRWMCESMAGVVFYQRGWTGSGCLAWNGRSGVGLRAVVRRSSWSWQANRRVWNRIRRVMTGTTTPRSPAGESSGSWWIRARCSRAGFRGVEGPSKPTPFFDGSSRAGVPRPSRG